VLGLVIQDGLSPLCFPGIKTLWHLSPKVKTLAVLDSEKTINGMFGKASNE